VVASEVKNLAMQTAKATDAHYPPQLRRRRLAFLLGGTPIMESNPWVESVRELLEVRPLGCLTTDFPMRPGPAAGRALRRSRATERADRRSNPEWIP